MKTQTEKVRTALFAAVAGVAIRAFAATVSVTAPGVYEAEDETTEFVISGGIDGDVSIAAATASLVTLSDASIAGTLSIDGDATLNLDGANEVVSDGASAITCAGALTIAGDGTLSATAAGAKKTGVIAAEDFTLAGGTTTVTILNPSKKNACGVSLSGDYLQSGGTLRIRGASNDYKQNGVFLATKKTTATIAGGTLDIALAGEKSVGLALDKATISGTMTGGTLVFALSGDGAKGIKGDGAFTMTGGTLDATLSGGVAEDYFEYEDEDGNTWNYYVTLTSSSTTSGGTTAYKTSSLIANGTYPVMDPAKCYAVKVGTLDVSGGSITVNATGTAGRGLGADSMTLSGGTFDITVSGGPTDVYVESLVDSDNLDDATYATGVATCLDAGSAACLKTGDDNGTLTISGGTFNLKATGAAGKLINAAGYLVIGTEGQTTLPDDASFSPDISGATTGAKAFCTALKQKYYGILATATATTDIASMTLATAADNLVAASSAQTRSSRSAPGGGGMMPGGDMDMGGGMAMGGGDDNADYSNPKGIKAVAGLTIHGGRIAVTTANDGGEGLESKDRLTINGGVLDLQCHDDAINSGGDLVINGGCVYAGSTGNDAIDSNANIYITGGVVLAFSTAGGAETGIDTDNSNGLVVSGGHLVAIGGAAGNMVVGSSGAQKTYKNASASASTYSGKYLSLAGTETFTVKMPELSGTISLVCTTEGWTSAKTPTVSARAPSSGALGFHDAYLSGYDSSDSGSSSSGSESATKDEDAESSDSGDNAVSGLASVYNGYVMDGEELVGTVLVKLGRANSRTGLARVSAKVKMLGLKKVSLAGVQTVSTTAPTEATLEKTIGGIAHVLNLRLAAESFTGSFDGLTVVGARNVSAAKEPRAAEYANWAGTWTAALAVTNAVGSSAALAGGYCGLSVKIAAKGKARVSGVMADGTKVSVSGQQLLLSADGSTACLPVVIPLYRGKLGGFGFLLTLARGDAAIAGLSGWDATPSTTGTFTADLAAVDVAPLSDLTGDAATFLMDVDAFPATISSRAVDTSLLPHEAALAVTGGTRLTAIDQTTRLRIVHRAATGLFSGSFVAFAADGARVSRKTVKVNGVFVRGVGYGAASIKKSFSVRIEIE